MGSYVTAWRRFTAWKKDGTFDIIRSCLPASVHLSDNATTPRKIKTGKCSLAMKKYSGQRTAPKES